MTYFIGINNNKIVYACGDKMSSFLDLLRKDNNSVYPLCRNVQTLVTEMFKITNNIAPEITKEIFPHI